MRKQTLLLMPLFFAQLSYGQVILTPKAGVTFAKQRVELQEWKEESLGQKSAFRTGVLIGISVELPVYKQIRLQSEFNFNQQGYTLKTESGYNLSETYRLNYLNLPVLAKAHISNSRFNPYALLGVYGGYLLGGKFKSLDFAGETSESSIPVGESSVNYKKRYDWGLQTGAGLTFPLAKGGLNIEAKYTFGLSSAQHEYTPEAYYYTVYQQGHNGKNSMLSLTLGYAISL